MLQFSFKKSSLLLWPLVLSIDFRNSSFCLDKQTFKLLFVRDKLLNLKFARMHSFPDLHKIYFTKPIDHHRLTHLTETHSASGLHIETDHRHIVHVVKDRSVEWSAISQRRKLVWWCIAFLFSRWKSNFLSHLLIHFLRFVENLNFSRFFNILNLLLLLFIRFLFILLFLSLGSLVDLLNWF